VDEDPKGARGDSVFECFLLCGGFTYALPRLDTWTVVFPGLMVAVATVTLFRRWVLKKPLK
jgi:hypothetical protein